MRWNLKRWIKPTAITGFRVPHAEMNMDQASGVMLTEEMTTIDFGEEGHSEAGVKKPAWEDWKHPRSDNRHTQLKNNPL